MCEKTTALTESIYLAAGRFYVIRFRQEIQSAVSVDLTNPMESPIKGRRFGGINFDHKLDSDTLSMLAKTGRYI